MKNQMKEKSERYDVGIMGVWSGCNYGSIATYYALNRIITGLGYSVLMIDKPRVSKEQDVELMETHSRRFAHEHYNISKVYKLSELKDLNEICDIFVIGSDQVWNYGISKNFGKSYYFDFVEDSKKKIAYASSFGHNIDFAPEDEIPCISELFGRFDAISVRETDGVRLLRDIYGIKGQQVLDPVFLTDRSIFDELAEKSAYHESEPYIATYILDPTSPKNEAILYVSEKLGYKLVNILDGFTWLFDENRKKLGMEAVENVTVEDWISILKNSEFIITDSCHGVSFALLYEKNFIAIANKKRGYSRFKSLADLYGFTDRLITNPKTIINNASLLAPMDYEKINAIIVEEKGRCYKWLKEALEAPKGERGKVLLPPNITIKLAQNLCAGCGACVSICPFDALSLQPDEYGYYRASVDYNKCTGCNKCIKVCPAIKLPENRNASQPQLFEFIAADEKVLASSSSGGVFPIFAKEVFKRGGVVVGAAWCGDFSVEHIIIDDEKNLYKLQKSKYLQSYLGNIFRQVKEKLDNNVFVLFTGCPCQVAGLKAYLGKDYNKLIKVDLLCGSAPSAMFFKKYIEEDFPEGLEKYEFRHKVQGWNYDCSTITMTTIAGVTEVRRGGKQDNYQRVYHNHTMCAPHCEKCKYQSVPRFGDLTIGDFWGISRKDKEIDTSKGISAILCNNEKGEKFLDSISKEMYSTKKQVPLEWLGGNGYAINGSHNYCSPMRDDFYKAIRTKSFSEAIVFALKPNHGVKPERGLFDFHAKENHFDFNPSIWSEDYINGTVVLTTKESNSKVGNYAVMPIHNSIKAGERYLFKIRFKLSTNAPIFNFHLKSAGETLIQVIYSHTVKPIDSTEWAEITHEFVPDSNVYDEFMIGASQLSGENRWLAIDYIKILKKC